MKDFTLYTAFVDTHGYQVVRMALHPVLDDDDALGPMFPCRVIWGNPFEDEWHASCRSKDGLHPDWQWKKQLDPDWHPSSLWHLARHDMTVEQAIEWLLEDEQ